MCIYLKMFLELSFANYFKYTNNIQNLERLKAYSFFIFPSSIIKPNITHKTF